MEIPSGREKGSGDQIILPRSKENIEISFFLKNSFPEVLRDENTNPGVV